jgi:hypothetical protein
MRRIREHLTYANVMATIAVFLVLGGGSAVALSGTNTVQSDDLGPGAQVKAPDVATGAVGSAAAINESLTGQDIKNQSGVDTCTHGTVRLGQLCVRGENQTLPWFTAAQHCASLDLRLPSFAEAFELATTHDIPNVGESEYFWTGNDYVETDGFSYADVVNDGANRADGEVSSSYETVCVTTPTN